MKYLTAGESHGSCLIGILSGLPYGIPITKKYIQAQLEGRRNVKGRGIRQEIEKDEFEIISGLREDRTDANPVGAIIYNRSVKKESFNYYTPGYGDLYGAIKCSHNEPSIIKERASARETAMRVLLFSFTLRFLELLEITFEEEVIKCYRENDRRNFKRLIDEFRKKGDSFGGTFQLKIKNIPPGIGDWREFENRLTSSISRILFSLGGVRSVEFGIGSEIINYKGSEINKKPEILGGIECGMTDGNDIIIRCTTRAISSIAIQQKTFDLKRKKNYAISFKTSDTTSVFASSYISKYLISYVIADEIMRKFGSDNFYEIKENVEKWRKKTKKLLKAIKG